MKTAVLCNLCNNQRLLMAFQSLRCSESANREWRKKAFFTGDFLKRTESLWWKLLMMMNCLALYFDAWKKRWNVASHNGSWEHIRRSGWGIILTNARGRTNRSSKCLSRESFEHYKATSLKHYLRKAKASVRASIKSREIGKSQLFLFQCRSRAATLCCDPENCLICEANVLCI